MRLSPSEKFGIEWLDIPSPWIDVPGRLRARCRKGESLTAVREAIGSGDSGRPYVLENESFRQMHFVRHRPHSVMRIADPTALVMMAYTCKMMAFLLFVPRPERILMLGLGGGSLAKYCHRHLPGHRSWSLSPMRMSSRCGRHFASLRTTIVCGSLNKVVGVRGTAH